MSKYDIAFQKPREGRHTQVFEVIRQSGPDAAKVFPGHPVTKPFPATEGFRDLADYQRENFNLRCEIQSQKATAKVDEELLRNRYDARVSEVLGLAEESAALARQFKVKYLLTRAELSARLLVVLIGLAASFWGGWVFRGLW